MSKKIEKKVDLENREKVELVKRMFAKGATDDEFALLLELSKRYNLDPFKKQIFYIPGTGILVSHAGMIHIAHQSGNWAGMKTFIITKDGEEKLIADDPRNIAGAVCYVYRKDWIEPLIHAVTFREYFKPSRSNYPSAWEKMPETMVKKVAEAGALRRAFDLGGLYIQEEMGEIENEKYDEKVEEPEIKETKKEVPNAYITRLYSYIQAFAKKFDNKEKDIEKYLEKKLGKSIKEFDIEDIKRAIEILKELIKKEKEKEKEKEEIKPDDFEIPEITVEEPEEITKIEKDEDEMNEWMKKISETFDEISE